MKGFLYSSPKMYVNKTLTTEANEMSAIVICSPATNFDFFNYSSKTDRLNVFTSPNCLNAYGSAGTYPNTCKA